MPAYRVSRRSFVKLLRTWDTSLALLCCSAAFLYSLYQPVLVIYEAVLAPAGMQKNASSSETVSPLQAILGAHFFDNDSIDTMGGGADPGDPRLRGVMVNDEASSYAFIASAGIEKSYKIGDLLPDGSTIDKILVDRVTVTKDGQQHELLLNAQQP